jgi:hypothetical protein
VLNLALSSFFIRVWIDRFITTLNRLSLSSADFTESCVGQCTTSCTCKATTMFAQAYWLVQDWNLLICHCKRQVLIGYHLGAEIDRRFGGAYCLHQHISETPVFFGETARRYIRGDCSLRTVVLSPPSQQCQEPIAHNQYSSVLCDLVARRISAV